MQRELPQRPRLFVRPPGQLMIRDTLENAPRGLRFLVELLQQAVD
jgi:hypothetical protein